MNIYVELTRAFNAGGLVAVLSSGQAVVLHRLAVMSKDGDWILRETGDALEHVLSVLDARNAHYRFGAPLDLQWMRGGWSSHFEFRGEAIRVRTDFVTRPPRLSPQALAALWTAQEGHPLPFVGVRELAELKKTNREKDYVVIGELARLLTDPQDQLLFSRSARDIIALAEQHPALIKTLVARRPVLISAAKGLEDLEAALDAERRQLIHANEHRLHRYLLAAERWRAMWPVVAQEIEGMPLGEAHRIVVERASDALPEQPEMGEP